MVMNLLVQRVGGQRRIGLVLGCIQPACKRAKEGWNNG